MWVFGYGSLMWDQWESCFHGEKNDHARLRNYQREFNKRSSESRGTASQPCPTLGLVKQRGSDCIGSAFYFEDKWTKAVLAYLRVREGASFKLVKKKIELNDGMIIQAYVPINNLTSSTFIGDRSLDERARMALVAKGVNGNCLDYVKEIYDRLDTLKITDECVEQMWAALQRSGNRE